MLPAWFALEVLARAGAWARLISALLQSGAVLAALSRARVSGRIRGLAVTAVALTVGGAVLSALGARYRAGVADLISAGLLVLIPVAVVQEFRRDLTVTMQSVLAALCVYVVLGMLFASAASAVSSISGSPYFSG